MSKKTKTKCTGTYENGADCRNYEPCKIHGENLQILHNKRVLLEALEKSLGIVTTACKNVNITRATFYNYIKDDADFAAAVRDIDNVALDFAESQLHKQIMDGVPASTIFYLKTKGKHRGYVERIEQTGKDGEPIQVETGAILILPDNGRDPVK